MSKSSTYTSLMSLKCFQFLGHRLLLEKLCSDTLVCFFLRWRGDSLVEEC